MSDRTPLSRFIAPRYWPAWIGMGLLRLLVLLPHSAGLSFGRALGRIGYAVGGTRRAIVRRNIELCFPQLSVDERDELARQHFLSLGMSMPEMAIGRWASDRKMLKLVTLEGKEHLDAALASGRGVILLSAHFTTLEMSGRVLSLNCPPFDAVYRKNKSDFVTAVQRAGREVSAADTIEKRDIKKMVRSLRNGRPVWYAPDQSYNRKGAEVIEFFGVPTMHTTATSTLARLGRAIVLPFFPQRLVNGRYVTRIYPALDNFPSGDIFEDTQAYVRVLEAHIRTCPEQYFWIHRKFKNLPASLPDFYADLEALK